MANLTAAKRRKMPKREFAGPGTSFPIPDKEHARLAISGATRSERAGNISESEETHIKSKARAKLGEGGGQGAIAVHPSMNGTGMFDAKHKRKY